MMLNIRLVEVYNSLVTYLPLGLFIGLFFFIEVSYLFTIEFSVHRVFISLMQDF